jgi:hypothetical protein
MNQVENEKLSDIHKLLARFAQGGLDGFLLDAKDFEGNTPFAYFRSRIHADGNNVAACFCD